MLRDADETITLHAVEIAALAATAAAATADAATAADAAEASRGSGGGARRADSALPPPSVGLPRRGARPRASSKEGRAPS